MAGKATDERRFYYESSLVENHKNISDSETRKNVLERLWGYHKIEGQS